MGSYRVNDVIILNGLKIAITPMEESARLDLNCSNVCLFSRQNDAGDEFLIVALEAIDFPNKKILDDYGRALDKYFKEIRFVKIPEFPRNENGMQKLNRKKILDIALDKIGQV